VTRSGAPAPGGSGTPPLADIRAAARRASAADQAARSSTLSTSSGGTGRGLPASSSAT